MTLELTQQQQKAMDQTLERPVRFIDPRSHNAYVLLPEEQYAAVKEILEDEARQKAISAAALKNAVKRMHEAG